MHTNDLPSSLASVPPARLPARDLGPLAWVMDELRQALDEAVTAVRQFVADQQAAQATDLAEVEATPLRMARQRLHQAAGALDMVELAASATTVRALEAALARLIQRPALATPETAHTVAWGGRCLLDQLQRVLRERPLPALALFPVYQEWQQLAGASRAHPADLWLAPEGGRDGEVPPGKAYQPGPAVRAHLDRLVLLVVKQLHPQAAAPLAQLAAGLCRGTPEPVAQRFWLAAAAYFEAVAQGLLPDSIHVKRAASSILLQYSHWSQGDAPGLPALTHDLHALLAQAPPKDAAATPCLAALWQAQAWSPEAAWNWEQRALGLVDPAVCEQAREAVSAARRWWAVWSEAPAPLADGASALLERVAEVLPTLHPACRTLGEAWAQVAALVETQRAEPAAWPRGLALELSFSLLCLGAELDDFDPLQPTLAERMAQLAHRLAQVLDGQPAPDPQPWMSEVYRRLSERETLDHVVGQVQAELAAAETLLDAWFRRTPEVPGLTELPAQLEALRGVLQMLALDAAASTVAAVGQVVSRWLNASSPAVTPAPEAPGWADDVALLGANLAALASLLDTFKRQPELARTAFVFDAASGRLHSSLSPTDAVPPATDASPPPSAAPEGSSEPTAQVATEDDDDEAELLTIFTDEAVEVLAQAAITLGVLRQHPDSLDDLTALRRGFHTLKGSARMVGLAELGEAAWAMEQLLNAWLADRRPATPPLLDLTAQVLPILSEWVAGLTAAPADASADAGTETSGRAAPIRASADVLRLHGESLPLPTAEAASIVEPAPSAEAAPELVPEVQPEPEPPLLDEAVKVIGPLCIDLELYNVFLNEADEWSRRLGHGLSEWGLSPTAPLDPQWSALAHSLAGGAGTVGHVGLSQLARALEHALDRAMALQAQGQVLLSDDTAVLLRAAEEARTLLHQFAAGFLKEPLPATLDALAAAAQTGVPLPADNASQVELLPQADAHSQPEVQPFEPDPAEPVVDTLDRDLFAVFEDEAGELLPRLGAALRQWVARPDNTGARAEVLRNLHTLKGSARLAGALRLGELVHELESAVLQLPEVPDSADAVRPLLGALDELVDRFEALRRVFKQAEAPNLAPEAEGVRLSAPEGLARPVAPARLEPLPVPSHMVRVRADLLDRLMTQTGDVMITRGRLENDMRALRHSFKDMSANIERLRSQLRDLEMQTETQMQSRLAQARDTDPRFDPLEFDRYTRVQELTRLLAESVNDVATVQHHLQRSVEAAEGSLAAQARQTRDLQRDLLRTRLVAFDTLAERLHRTLRQAAEATGKSVALALEGAEVEVDRGVLDRLAPVLEHLLRNAVVHGIESPAQRAAAGKPAEGHVTLYLEQNGNDLSLTLADDGAGLDVPSLRERAVALGLQDAAAPFDWADAARSIFAPGLTTASAVTELAGRGIGLDVVRNEVLGLGGRIEPVPTPGGGTGFHLVVPLSTAVTQVVMLRVGDFTFGVPAPWVEAVRRAQAPELTAAYVSAQWRAGDALMPFYWAGALLALSTESTDPQAHTAHSWPVLEFYSAGQRVAWHVDEVLGHQEVVVKPLGPQLAHLPGLAGATVLASGAVALIYNPVALASLYGEAARAWARAQRAQGVQGVVPVPALRPTGAGAGAGAQAEPPLVLVVDDSITVRRVTQRLLKREGYRVALAADGLQALERLREELPVVVLCDIEMPRMDGFEFVRHLHDEPAWADLPVVMITSRLADKHREHAETLGVDHYLGKPYSEEELLALVAAYVRLAP